MLRNHRRTKQFWLGRKVLVTGHTGFKGGWLALWLKNLGATVVGIALPPSTTPNLFQAARIAEIVDSHYCDIRDSAGLEDILQENQPEVIFHLAAQPLVRASYRDPLGTFSTNIMGTATLLDRLRGLECVRVGIVITTDKVYHNREWAYPYRETDPLGGHDPYSASKAACELVVASYRDSFLKNQGTVLASARAGNVIGGGDWAEDRLIPDAIRAWQAGLELKIRAPRATRPWQHVLEPLDGYLTLAEKLWAHPELEGAYNFGPPTHDAKSVREIVELARKAFGGGGVGYDDEPGKPHEARALMLETAKAQLALGVSPRWSLDEAIERTVAWYKAQSCGEDPRRLCEADIAAYEGCG